MDLLFPIKNVLKRYLYYRRITKNRIRVANKDLTKKGNYAYSCPINNNQKNDIKSVWDKYNVNIDYRWFNFYNYINMSSQELKYYIPHDLYYKDVDTFFSDPILAKTIDDKNLYDLFFYDVNQPKTIVRKENGLLLDAAYNIIDIARAIELCNEQGYVIVKPSVLSEGGRGISFWEKGVNNQEELRNILTDDKSYIISEVVMQSEMLKKIHSSSLNTIRIISLMMDNKVNILSTIIRMGVNGNKVDNAASGGIFCGIKEDGCLKDIAYDSAGNKYQQHPQGGALSQFQIPNFKKCIELVEKIAPRMAKYSLLCSWDICIDKNDEPQLIEVNLTFGDVQLHQMTNGPIFGNRTVEILDKVYTKNKK